jgi:hypothetical protein
VRKVLDAIGSAFLLGEEAATTKERCRSFSNPLADALIICISGSSIPEGELMAKAKKQTKKTSDKEVQKAVDKALRKKGVKKALKKAVKKVSKDKAVRKAAYRVLAGSRSPGNLARADIPSTKETVPDDES